MNKKTKIARLKRWEKIRNKGRLRFLFINCFSYIVLTHIAYLSFSLNNGLGLNKKTLIMIIFNVILGIFLGVIVGNWVWGKAEKSFKTNKDLIIKN